MDNRDFESVEQMNEVMIEKWNKKVHARDEVVILGDLSLGNGKETNEILCRLKGRLYLIRGNHDERLHKSARVCHLHGLFSPFRRRFSATLSGLLATQTIFLNNERGTSKNAVTTFKEVHRNDGLQENSYASKYGVQPTRNGTQ